MTQDELRAALLLAGFTPAKDNSPMTYRKCGQLITVYCNILEPGDVNVSYRTKASGGGHWRGFRASPEVVFNFIKEKLI